MKIHVKCEGVTPILFNPKTDDVIAQLMKSKTARKQSTSVDTTPEEIAAKKVLRDEKGRAGLPGRYLFGNLSEAGRDVQLDARRKLSTAERTLLPSFLRVEETFMPFLEGFKGTDGWITDKDMGRPDPRLPTMPIIRPRFDKWSFGMTLDVYGDIAEGKVRELVDKGGLLGLGAFRKKGPYGRYKVVDWKVEDKEGETEKKQTDKKKKTGKS